MRARKLAETAGAALADADLVLTVRRPDRLDGMKRGAALVALMDPYGNEAALHRMAEAGLSALSLELIPRSPAPRSWTFYPARRISPAIRR
jgi:NAD(P) transhydrogenase subunit alpha